MKSDREYELNGLGYDLGGVAARVAEIYEKEVELHTFLFWSFVFLPASGW